MKKLLPYFCFILLPIAVLAGCQNSATPEERLDAYISQWEEGNFEDLYTDYLTQGTKDAFGTEQFVERQEKIRTDLSIKNLDVSVTETPEETEWNPEEPADFPIRIRMDTLAGPVEYEKTITLLHETREESENWYVEWDPSFILPGLETEDAVRISADTAARGEILDRAGRPVAMNGTGYEVGIVPEQFTDEAKKTELASLLGITAEQIDAALGQSWVQPNLFVPVKKLAGSQEDILEKAEAIPGVTHRETGMREYPYGEALSHLVGYIGSITAEQLETLEKEGYSSADVIGRQGLERLLEDRLRGENGVRIFIEKAGSGEQLPVAEKPASDGETVTLTVDAELQKTVYSAMRGEAGTSAAVDPKTGETLALVSSPGFDPNEFIAGISGERYQELTENPLNPLFNRFAAAYAPGSSIKPVTAAIGLEAGTLDPSEGRTISGKTWQKDGSWGDYHVTRVHPEAPNPIDLNKALVYSDNIYFAQEGLDMGEETLVEGLKSYGFGEDIPFALELTPSQVSNDGTLSSEGQLADTSFGQGQMLTNILHLASMYQAFLSDGTMYKPVLFEEEEKGQVWKEGLVTAEHASVLRTGLRNVVTGGFAQPANLPDIPLAGKTGTAELKATKDEEGKENGYFVSYNSENPAFILAMMIEGVEDNGGSVYTAELAATVYKEMNGGS